MNLTPRLKQIIIVLLKSQEAISVKELASQIGVSKRTVQRELEYLGNDLREYHIEFRSKTGTGVWLDGTEENKNCLKKQLEQEDIYDSSNREERRKRLILEILREKGLKKLFAYASQFDVSEATISSDLECIEGWLNDQNLYISRKPGSGVEINGSEESYRKAIRTFISDNIDTNLIREAYDVSRNKSAESIGGTGISQVLNEDVLKRVTECLDHQNDLRVKSLTENSYMGLVLHISIAINRILQNDIIEQNQQWSEQIPKDEDYDFAQDIVKALEQAFEIKIPNIEASYICLHIKGAKHQKILLDNDKSISLERRELLELVNEMIDAYDMENAYLLKQDNDFIQGLLAHLQPTFVRLTYDMKISNPVLEDIKVCYPEDYERSKAAAGILERWVGKSVPEEEIGFLAIHFGAAKVRMEGRKENIRRVSVGVVCASGIGISRLMQSKLDKTFRDRIHIETYGQNDITPYVAGKVDFFVSSIPWNNEDVDIIQVNPLLNDQDMENVRQKIFHYERMPKIDQEETKFTLQMEEINTLAMQIKLIIKYMDVFKVSNDIRFEELVSAIAQRMSPYGDRQDIIEEDILSREKLGSQIFSEFGFALLHTRTKGVIRPEFHICRTRNQGSFSHDYFKGISVVLIMLIPIDDNLKINSEILGFISSTLIEDYDFLATIEMGEKEEIRDTVSEHLRQFFNQYLNRYTT